jgi:hypothetical protein
MTHTETASAQHSEPAPEEHLPGGRNPRDNPCPQLDASPPQPDVPEQSKIEQEQDHQPLDPAPLLNRPSNPREVQREIKNG